MTNPTNEPEHFPEIDGYDIIDLVGAGGMGMVYEAIQRATGRRIALKVMRDTAMASDSAKQRFEREVEFIARLDHPGIVAVLDSGVHEGTNYCVMDFVEGQLLDDSLIPGECDPAEALTMIERISRAVDYAHQRGVLHRDLKPSNVLVDEQNEPHLLDFGLAKAIDPVSAMGGRRTISEQGQLIGTIAYMAPEQARGEISELSVRTDVYALGAIAYELLTGKLPIDVTGSLGETLNRLETRDPARPGSVRKGLGADTDAILHKALEKNPNTRYETAGAFADDIRRMLDGYPIRARRIGPIGRTARWINRNRRVSAVAGIALVMLLIVSAFGVYRVIDERSMLLSKEAELSKMFESLGPNMAGADVTVRELLQDYADNLEANPIDDPRVECEVRQRLGSGFFEVRLYEQAERHLRRALNLRERTGRGGPEALATSQHELAATLWFRGEYTEAAPLYEHALGLRESTLGADHADVAETMAHLAMTYTRLKRHDEAEALHRRALSIRMQTLGPDHEFTAASRMSLGEFLYVRGRHEEAATIFRESVDQVRRKRGNEHEGVAIGLTNLSVCLFKLDRCDEAREALEESLSIKETIWGVDSDTYAWSQYHLSQVEKKQGNDELARILAESAEWTLFKSLGDAHEKTNKARELLWNILAENANPV